MDLEKFTEKIKNYLTNKYYCAIISIEVKETNTTTNYNMEDFL
jgi:hypothetical protein